MSKLRLTCCVLLALTLVACAPSVKRPAPVEDRMGGTSSRAPQAPVSSAPHSAVGSEPGTYVVQRGDTLAKIAMDHGVGWRDLARWNQMDNPNVIEVGQVLRVTPPSEAGARSVTGRPLSPSAVTRPTSPAASAAGSGMTAATPAAPTTPPAPALVTPIDDAPAFLWPAQGSLLSGFDEARNKGLDIAGKPGDAVLAAADGRVVYAGSGLRGYGNLIILKHNNTYLTAYAHNQALLVKEDQDVRRGQKIAEMGNSDADQVKLHFEIRRQGKPVDPARLLPPR
jgi:lipoprotein NlpD